ncbi:receptor activity-modifying protein 3 isoform X1 [Tursiops truncatus]
MKCTQTTTCQKPWCAEEPRHSTSEAASPDGPAGRVGPPLVSGNVTAKQSPTLTTTFPLWKLRPREGRTAHGHMESEHPGLLQPPRPPHASPSWPGARSQLDGAPLGRRDGGVTYEGDQQDQQQGLLVPWGQFSSLTQEIVQESSEEELNSGHTPALHTGWAGSGRAGSAAMAHGPSRSAACGIFPDRGMNPCPLHRQADSQPLRHQGSLKKEVLIRNGCSCVSGWMGKLRLSCDLPEHQLHATGVCRRAGPRFEAREVGEARLQHVLQRDFMRIRSLMRHERHCSWPSVSYCWRSFSSTISHLLSLLQSVTLLACSLDASPWMPAVVPHCCTFQGECPPVGGCNEKRMLAMLPHCGQTFAERMKKVEVWKWCNLSEFIVYYESFTNCTEVETNVVGCYWPNPLAESFIAGVHRRFFQNCSVDRQHWQDPPDEILIPLIAVPILLTIAMTGVVVWRSKRTDQVV